MKDKNRDLPENFEKLHHVPVFAVRKLLTDLLPDETGLLSMTGSELISLAADTPAVTEHTIDHLYEEYRYGGRASFYLYLLDSSTEDVEQLLANLEVELENLSEEGEIAQSYKVELRDIERLDLDLAEVRYKYETVHKYIDPEDESPASISELHFGFFWLNLPHGYLIIMSKYEEINRIVECLVERTTGLMPFAVQLTPYFVNRQFSYEAIRSASWQDFRSGLRRRISGEQMMDVVGEEVQHNDKQSQRTASLYDESIADELSSRLGITLRKGKLYLTRTIPTSKLRQWMYSRLHPLLLSLKELEPVEQVIVSGMPLPQLGLSATGEEFFRYIVRGVLQKRAQREANVRMPYSDGAVYASMKHYFVEPQVFFDCDECDETSPVCCPKCGGDKIVVRKAGLRCAECDFPIEGPEAEVSCIRGHTSALPYPHSDLVLRPNCRLQKEVADFVNDRLPGESFNPDEEFFWIEHREIQYVRDSSRVVFVPNEIKEFGHLPSREEISLDVWDGARELVANLKEKCRIDLPGHTGQPRREDCEECYQRHLGRLCSPKLFRALSPDFMPLPHGGLEFGDAGLKITLDNQQLTFVAIVKSGQGKPVGIDGGLGKEILQQIIRQVLRDARVEAFGIALPRPLNEELRATIVMLAKMGQKKVSFWGHDELTHLCAALLIDPNHQALLPGTR